MDMDCKEIEIPVPWGLIAGKTWGKTTDPLVLALHGWADNANSFDPLMRLLPNCFYYVCVDLPGHGKSTALKTTVLLRDIDYIMAIKFIYDYLKCDRITIIGHSLGGFLTLLFSQFYPNCVSKIILFDTIYCYPRSSSARFEYLLMHYNVRMRFLQKENSNGPVYTKEEIFEKLMRNRLTPMSEKAVKILLDRSIEPTSDGKYRITTSQNVKHLVFSSQSMDTSINVMEKCPIRCPHLLILSSNSYFLKFAFRKIENIYKKNIYYEFHTVNGSHEVHLESPERVAPIVSKFLLKYKCKL